MCNFFLHYQYIVNQTGDENHKNHQLGDIVCCNTKFCELTFKRYVWQSVRRLKNIQIKGMKGLIKGGGMVVQSLLHRNFNPFIFWSDD